MTRRFLALSLVLCALALAACSSSRGATPADAGVDGGGARDMGGIVDADVDGGARVDGGPFVATCEPMAAQIDVCGTPCFGVTSAFWDGAECVAAHCDCVGAECEVYATVEACSAAHAMCDATLCASTGGAWFNRLEWCGHFSCGVPNPDSCESPTRACDCGTYRNFSAGVGCTDGPLCELLAPMPPETLCTSTGGEWMLGICGHTSCGRFSGLDCASPGCACSALENFDTDRGCIRGASCDVRQLGESCDDTGLCGDGNVCCVSGGASMAAHCEAPLCSDPSGVCGPPRP